jgi:hypothetical protein
MQREFPGQQENDLNLKWAQSVAESDYAKAQSSNAKPLADNGEMSI